MFGPESRVVVVVGAQWGDEGKGKLVDVLAERADWVVRYQGGANAGHTVRHRRHVVRAAPDPERHPAPGRALRDRQRRRARSRTRCSPRSTSWCADGIDVEGRLYVSERAHLVLPYHKLVDGESAASKAIGTTGRGIGPAYEDKVARRGVRVLDLRHPERLRELVEQRRGARERAARALRLRHVASTSTQTLALLAAPGAAAAAAGRGRRARACTARCKSGAAVLLEGAQGSLLDIDHGTYPFVTSSNTTVGRRGGRRRASRRTAIDARARRREGVHDARRQRPAADRARGAARQTRCARSATSSARRRGARAAAAGSTRWSCATRRA